MTDRMTGQSKAQKDINTNGRLTPFDVKTKGTFAEVTPAVKPPVREPTSEERQANNYAKVELGRKLGEVHRLVPTFKEDLKEMNRGKMFFSTF